MRRKILRNIIMLISLVFLTSSSAIQIVRADSVWDYRTIPDPHWSVVSFHMNVGDHLTASWHAEPNPIDVYVLGEFDYEQFIASSKFNALAKEINETDGYIDVATLSEGVLFTIFHANYSNSNVFFHVSVLRDIDVNCTCNCTGCSPQPSGPNLIPGFSLAVSISFIVVAVVIISYKLKKR